MPAPPPADVRDNLPRPLTSFIGRADELGALGGLIRSVRLLTLTGVGGCGKTRLAREAAMRALDAFPGGVRWVELAPLADGALVPEALAAAWGVVEQPGCPVLETLMDALAPRRALIVLDNCEHLIESCARCAQRLLDSCPELTILATSREPLGIPGEAVVPIAPLPVPDGLQRVDAPALARADAVRLFVERARAAASSFALTDENVPDVVRICRQLDGIPLALELAAARVRLLGVRQIAERLHDAFQVLGGGARAALPRQQTLRATLDWSYALLSPAEASLFRRLAVFAGSFSLEAVEAVCAAPGEERGETLDALARLVDKSLVLAQERAGAVYYRLLEVIRQYAREKLAASAEDTSAYARHWDYYGHLAQQAANELDSGVQRRWLDVLEDDIENLRAAFTWSLGHANAERAGVVIAALWRFWLMRGYLAEGRRWLDLALARVPDATLARAHVLHGLTVLTHHHRGYALAAPLVEETLAIYQTLDDRHGLAAALLNAGIVAHSHGDYARAVTYFEQSLPICSELAWAHGSILCLSSMGFAVLHLGDLPRAQALCAEAVALAREAGDDQQGAAASANLGIALLLGEHYDLATARLEESLRLRREIGDAGGIAHTLCYLGRAALEQGNSGRAEACYLESFALRDELGDDAGLAAALEGLAALAAARGDGMTAALRLGAAETLHERASVPVPTIDRPFYERWLATTRDLLDERAFAAAWTAGRALGPREARDLGAGRASAPTAAPASAVGVGASAPASTTDEGRPAPASDDRPHHPRLRIFALGEARVFRGADLVGATEWTYSRARELLFFLLCRDSATKEQIGLALWPDADATQLRVHLHPVLHHLRQALGAPEWVVFERGRYRFSRALAYAFDVEAFETHLEQSKRAQREDPALAIRHLEQALQLYRGDFLASETAGEWAERQRAELRRRRREALQALGRLHTAAGAHARAADAYRQLIADDPYQERAHRELMRSLARLGERAQALRTFEGLAELLERELGAAPAPETAALAERVRRGEPV